MITQSLYKLAQNLHTTRRRTLWMARKIKYDGQGISNKHFHFILSNSMYIENQSIYWVDIQRGVSRCIELLFDYEDLNFFNESFIEEMMRR